MVEDDIKDMRRKIKEQERRIIQRRGNVTKDKTHVEEKEEEKEEEITLSEKSIDEYKNRVVEKETTLDEEIKERNKQLSKDIEKETDNGALKKITDKYSVDVKNLRRKHSIKKKLSIYDTYNKDFDDTKTERDSDFDGYDLIVKSLKIIGVIIPLIVLGWVGWTVLSSVTDALESSPNVNATSLIPSITSIFDSMPTVMMIVIFVGAGLVMMSIFRGAVGRL